MTVVLPPFPVDEATLASLEAAMDPWSHGHPEADRSSLWDFLDLMSELGGADTRAVDAVDDPSDPTSATMRDPHYTDHCVIAALIAEVRRLRAGGR